MPRMIVLDMDATAANLNRRFPGRFHPAFNGGNATVKQRGEIQHISVDLIEHVQLADIHDNGSIYTGCLRGTVDEMQKHMHRIQDVVNCLVFLDEPISVETDDWKPIDRRGEVGRMPRLDR